MGVEKLIEAYKAGDQGAADQLVDLVQDKLSQFCIYLSGDRHLAEDLCHDALIRALTSIDQLQNADVFLAWVKKIARNLFLDFKKAAAQSKVHVTAEDSIEVEQLEGVGLSDDQLDAAKTLQKMSEADRTLLILIEVQGLSYQEAAEVLETKEGTIKSRLSRAKQKFVEIYGTISQDESSSSQAGSAAKKSKEDKSVS